jgi:hypothetical protein
MKWLKINYSQSAESILIYFPVTGHSSLPADKVLWRVETVQHTEPFIVCREIYRK